MRIVAGQYKGRRLDVPKGQDIRPTSDKVRGAIFNALESRGAVRGSNVLDCFCGSGALGLEALSRGAEYCTFWDRDPKSLAAAKSNAQSLDVLGQSAFHLRDALKAKTDKTEQEYDLVFLDPPYRNSLITPVLQRLIDNQYVCEDAVFVLEAEKSFDPNLDGSFKVQFEKTYGDTVVFIVSRTGI